MSFKLLLITAQVAQKVFPCSTWFVSGVVGEHTHVCAQGHSVAGSGWVVSCLQLLFMGRWTETYHNRLHIFHGVFPYVVLLVNTNMRVASYMMFMMLLQLQNWCWVTATAVVVAVVPP